MSRSGQNKSGGNKRKANPCSHQSQPQTNINISISKKVVINHDVQFRFGSIQNETVRESQIYFLCLIHVLIYDETRFNFEHQSIDDVSILAKKKEPM